MFMVFSGLLVHVYFCCVRFGFFSAMLSDWLERIIDVKNINLQIKNIKNVFFHFYKKNILKDMHKKHQTAISIQVRT